MNYIITVVRDHGEHPERGHHYEVKETKENRIYDLFTIFGQLSKNKLYQIKAVQFEEDKGVLKMTEEAVELSDVGPEKATNKKEVLIEEPPEDVLDMINQLEDQKDKVNQETNLITSENKYTKLDTWDEQQMLDEMRGKVVTQYVYQFDQWNPVTGKTEKQTAISWAGIKAIVQTRENFKILDDEITETDDYFYARVKILDVTRNIEGVGRIRQPKKEFKRGQWIDDPHAYTKSLSKATRNAYRQCLDEALIAAMIAEFLAKKQKMKGL